MLLMAPLVLDIKPIMKEFMPKEEIVQPKWATDIMKRYWKGNGVK